MGTNGAPSPLGASQLSSLAPVVQPMRMGPSTQPPPSLPVPLPGPGTAIPLPGQASVRGGVDAMLPPLPLDAGDAFGPLGGDYGGGDYDEDDLMDAAERNAKKAKEANAAAEAPTPAAADAGDDAGSML